MEIAKTKHDIHQPQIVHINTEQTEAVEFIKELIRCITEETGGMLNGAVSSILTVQVQVKA